MNPPLIAPVLLGLGSNLGDRRHMIQAAIHHLQENEVISQVRLSPVYETPALLPEGAPADWDIPFFNAVAVTSTRCAPHVLLAQLKQTEHFLGRQNRGHWGPREIDIDLLAYATLVLQDDVLTLPHPRLHERAFVLKPLCDVMPFWTYPEGARHAGRTAQKLLDMLEDETVAECVRV